MKYDITFAEMSVIFKNIAKIDEMNAKYEKATNEFEIVSAEFDRILDETGAVDSDMLDAKIASRNLVERIERAIFKCIRETAEMMEPNKYEYREARIMENAKARRSFELRGTIYSLKTWAMEQSKYIDI